MRALLLIPRMVSTLTGIQSFRHTLTTRDGVENNPSGNLLDLGNLTFDILRIIRISIQMINKHKLINTYELVY